MNIEEIKEINKLNSELYMILYGLMKQEKVQDEKELLKDFVSELDYYLKEFVKYENEKRERGK